MILATGKRLAAQKSMAVQEKNRPIHATTDIPSQTKNNGMKKSTHHITTRNDDSIAQEKLRTRENIYLLAIDQQSVQ